MTLLNKAISALENFKSSLSSLQGFRYDLLRALKGWYKSEDREKLYTLATILDSQFKGSAFQNKESLEYAKLVLIDEINKISGSVNTENQEPAQQTVVNLSGVKQHKIHSM